MWYPHTTLILSLAFQKPYFKSNNLKRVLLQTKDVLDFKNLYLKTLPCFIKRFQNSKLCEINYCLRVRKTAFKKMEFWKVLPHSKLLASLKRFEKLAPISKCFVKRCFKPFVCVFENFEKSGLLQMAFCKNGSMKTWFQSLLKMLYLQKVLVYQI